METKSLSEHACGQALCLQLTPGSRRPATQSQDVATTDETSRGILLQELEDVDGEWDVRLAELDVDEEGRISRV